MGQAKKRGVFEERKSQAIERKRREDEERLRVWREREARMTPEEKQARIDRAMAIAAIAPFLKHMKVK